MGVNPICNALSRGYTNSQRLGHEHTERHSLSVGQTWESPFSAASDLIGATVRMSGGENIYEFLPSPPKPSGTGFLYMDTNASTAASIQYSDYDGVFDKPILITRAYEEMWPVMSDAMTGHTSDHLLCYVYERTGNTLGLDVTVEPGWYVLSQTTFEVVPYDIAANPVRVYVRVAGHIQSGDFYSVTSPVTRQEFVVTADHIKEVDGYYHLCDRAILDDALGAMDNAELYVFMWLRNIAWSGDGETWHMKTRYNVTDTVSTWGTIDLYIPKVKTIDEKFLPPMVETINLDDYGVDLAEFLLSGGGKKVFDAPGLGEAMCVESEIEIVSEAYGFKCRPVTVGRSNGIPCYFGFRLCLATGTGVTLADITITSAIDGTTFLDTIRVWIGNISQITH